MEKVIFKGGKTEKSPIPLLFPIFCNAGEFFPNILLFRKNQ